MREGSPVMPVTACGDYQCGVASLSKFSTTEHGGAAGKYITKLIVDSSSSSSHVWPNEIN